MRFKIIQSIGLSIFYAISVHAASMQPTAMIMGSNGFGVRVIKKAYNTMLKMDKGIFKLLDITHLSIVEGDTSDRDTAFQAKKYLLEKNLTKPKLSFRVFGNQEMTIHINYGTNHLKFILHNLQSEVTSLSQTNVHTSQEANAAILVLKNIASTVDLMLPSDLTEEALTRFSVPDKFETFDEHLNEIALFQPGDNTALLQSLIELRLKLKGHLNDMTHIAQFAAQQGHTEEELYELESEYNSKTSDFFYKILTGQYEINTQIPLFHDVKFTFRLNKQPKEYFFPKLDLDALQLISDNLIDTESKISSLKHLVAVLSWAQLWIITGKTQLSEINWDNLDPWILSALDLDPKQKTMLFKNIQNIN